MLTCNKGFTLIEVLIVIVIIAILTATGIPYMRDWIDSADYRNASQQVLQALRQGRSQAVAKNRQYRVEFDLDQSDNTYSYRLLEGNRAANSTGWTVMTLWDDSNIPASVVLREAADCQGSADFIFGFNTNGTSNAGTICIMNKQNLAAGAERYKVRIANANTGRVTIE